MYREAFLFLVHLTGSTGENITYTAIVFRIPRKYLYESYIVCLIGDPFCSKISKEGGMHHLPATDYKEGTTKYCLSQREGPEVYECKK